jgi:hypothetical protein
LGVASVVVDDLIDVMRLAMVTRRRDATAWRLTTATLRNGDMVAKVLPSASEGAGAALPHILRISGARKSVVAVTGRQHGSQMRQ